MYYLAIDIGASSGCHMLGWIENGKLVLEEIHRFENKTVKIGDHICWEIDRLFKEIVKGMKKCVEKGKIPYSMGIDCFGVDFVLLDENDNIIGDTVAYRDKRTNAIFEETLKLIPDLYKRTGISSKSFNTIYQLYSLKKEHPEYFDKARRFLMLPEYFNFLLTGEKLNEYTNGTTTQLVNSARKEYDKDIIELLGIPYSIFGKLNMPGTFVGNLNLNIKDEIGFDCRVILPGTHDTASAVAAVPTSDECIYISSGTWSLMGTILDESETSADSEAKDFTNEGGVTGIRYLKNIMGLWIIQSIKRELNNKYSYQELSEMAEKSSYSGEIDVNDDAFFSPSNMIDAINEHFRKNCAHKPDTIGGILKAVYHGLATSYAKTALEIEEITGKKFESIYIIGGGCRDMYLNKLTEQKSGKRVYAGPDEATAIGNLLVQIITSGECTYDKVADLVSSSFDVKHIEA